MSRKHWCINEIDKTLACSVADEFDIDPFAALLLVSRGITDGEKISDFFDNDAMLSDPFTFIDMDKAVERINRAIDCDEKIAVYGDYDADGVTATALLCEYLEMNGCDVVPYIPDRNGEGYGLNCNAVRSLCESGVSLIITVDNGISAHSEAEYIKQLGMDLVITDHHKVGETIPEAVAVVNPHRSDCPSEFKHFAGVGVAFKLVCALCGDDEQALSMFADLVTIGTVGDIVSLTGENRLIVKKGLEMLENGSSLGIEALKEIAGVSGKTLTCSSVAFSLVPRINAMGRMGHASKALELLLCDNESLARSLAKEIDFANVRRQETEREITLQAQKQIEEKPEMLNNRVLIFSGENWHSGVIGIVAARLVQKYGKPCLVITDDGTEAKGSARSIDGFSLYECISSAKHLLTHYGGHVLAAGFGMESRNLDEFKKAVEDYAKTVDMPFARIELDCRLRPEFISSDILSVIDALEPFGAGNPQPVFGLFGMTLTGIQPIGSGKHLRLTLKKGTTTLTGLLFGVTQEDFPYVQGDIIDLAVKLERNEYMGQVKVSIYIKEIRMSRTDDLLYLKSRRLYEKILRGDRLSKKEADFALPERQQLADVFRFIRNSGGWKFDTDVLCYRLGGDGSNACKVLLCIDVLCELGIFRKEGESVIPDNMQNKVNLEDSSLIQYLKKSGKES
ncbi:MAG: single-stranded-DNA-specific exonuclease RecJ [Ruminococcaceae bacterium]|nr:single-stranded-DNA-specific exonuclease RecJ [Oscillospiraceae bacterium]